MNEMSETTQALKDELLKMAARKVEIEKALDAMGWPEGEMRIEDPDEVIKLQSIGFYVFWSPSSMNC